LSPKRWRSHWHLRIIKTKHFQSITRRLSKQGSKKISACFLRIVKIHIAEKNILMTLENTLLHLFSNYDKEINKHQKYSKLLVIFYNYKNMVNAIYRVTKKYMKIHPRPN